MAQELPAALISVREQAIADIFDKYPQLPELAERFAAAGHELAAVGGMVRDAVLSEPLSQDVDLTTSAPVAETARILEDWAGTTWDAGARFGTIGAQRDGVQWEVTTYRADSYDPESRKPTVEFGDNLDDDLIRRDFTVNAMAIRLPEGEFVDPTNGLIDLAARRLRTPTDPEVSFGDDPLRMLRACRFVSQLDIHVAPETLAAMHDMAERIDIVSSERIAGELNGLLVGRDPRHGLEVLISTGLADRILPEVPALKLEIDEHHRHKDVYEHSLTVLEQAIDLEEDGPDLQLRLAALLHDIGKPKTRRFEPGGGVSFHHHEVVGARMTKKRLKQLHYPKEVVDNVSRLVELHLRFHGYGTGQWSDSAVRRYVRDAGDLLPRLHKLTRADCTTRNKRRARALQAAYDDLEARIEVLAEEEELANIRPELDGNQIMTLLNIPAGPLVGKAYKYLLGVRLDQGPIGPEAAEVKLREWAREQGIEGA